MRRYKIFYMKELTLKELQNESLNILKNVHRFCVEHNIRYTVSYGTMIGAVRHKGFIPWDDDVDIFMPRPDYDRFCSTYSDDRYVLVNKDKRSDCLIAFTRVCDTKETCIKTLMPWIRSQKDLGVWIDIFPLDAVSDDPVSFEKTYTKLKRLYDLSGRRRKALRAFSKEKPLSYNLNTIKKRVLAFFKRRPEFYIDKITEICGSYSYGSTSYVAQLACPGIMARYDIKDVESVHLTDFEDTQLYIADGFDRMMKAVYGDYMKLPPENERVPQQDYIHFYWKE